jgi:hypothetical protein
MTAGLVWSFCAGGWTEGNSTGRCPQRLRRGMWQRRHFESSEAQEEEEEEVCKEAETSAKKKQHRKPCGLAKNYCASLPSMNTCLRLTQWV